MKDTILYIFVLYEHSGLESNAAAITSTAQEANQLPGSNKRPLDLFCLALIMIIIC